MYAGVLKASYIELIETGQTVDNTILYDDILNN